MTVEFQLHPYCSLFPVASELEIATVSESIRQDGQQEPIVRYQGLILDGRNRYLACQKAGIEPTFVEYDGDTSDEGLLRFVLSRNASRRHLRGSQKAMLAAQMSTKRNGNDGDAPIGALLTQAEAIAVLGVKKRTVQRAAKLLREAAPELIEEVVSGKKNVYQALDEHESSKKSVNKPKKSAKETGKTVTSTPDADKEKTYVAPPPAPSKSEGAVPQKSAEPATVQPSAETACESAYEHYGDTLVATPESDTLPANPHDLSTLTDTGLDASKPSEPTKKPKSSDQAFKERVQSGEFDGKLFKKNVKSLDTALEGMEGFETMYRETFELTGSREEEETLERILQTVDKQRNSLSGLVKEFLPKTTMLTGSPATSEPSPAPIVEHDLSAFSDTELDDQIQSMQDERNRRSAIGGNLFVKFVQTAEKVRNGIIGILSLHGCILDSVEDSEERQKIKQLRDQHLKRIKSLYTDIAALNNDETSRHKTVVDYAPNCDFE